MVLVCFHPSKVLYKMLPKRFKFVIPQKKIKINKIEYYSRIPRLSDTRYSASVNANTKFHNFSGISIDIGE